MALGQIDSEAPAPRRGLKRFVKAAGGIVAGLILLDLVAGALTVWLGAGFIKP